MPMNHVRTRGARFAAAVLLLAVVMNGCGGDESGRAVDVEPTRDCTACGGDARVSGTCAVCGGNGHRTSGVFGRDVVMCSACGGTGSVSMRCQVCGGTGRRRVRRPN